MTTQEKTAPIDQEELRADAVVILAMATDSSEPRTLKKYPTCNQDLKDYLAFVSAKGPDYKLALWGRLNEPTKQTIKRVMAAAN